jgi:hypothetical protein
VLWLLTIGFLVANDPRQELELFVHSDEELGQTDTLPSHGEPIVVPPVVSPMELFLSKPPNDPGRLETTGIEYLPARVALDGENGSNAYDLFATKEDLPILAEDGGRFGFNVFSPDALKTLNRLCDRRAAKASQGATVSVAVTSLTAKSKADSPCQFMVKATNTGKDALSDVFLTAEFGQRLPIQAASFGGIATYRSESASVPTFRRDNAKYSSTSLIGFDYDRNQVIFHFARLDVGEWVQFVVVVQPLRPGKCDIRAGVISEQGATAKQATSVIVDNAN